MVTHRDVLRHALGHRVVVLRCLHDPEVEAEAGDCLGDLPAYVVLDLLRVGVEKVLIAAADCSRPEGLAGWLDKLVALVGPRVAPLATGQRAPRGAKVLTLGTSEPPAPSRRALLGLRSEPLPTHDPGHDDQERLLVSLAALGMAPIDSVPPTGVLLSVDGCVGCGVCVRACGHDALDLRDFGGLGVLRHDVAACRGDGACVAACPVGAIATRGTATWADVQHGSSTLARVPVQRCAKCRGLFPSASDGELCEVCQQRLNDPFGSVLPTK